MKRLILTAAIAVLSVAAIAQTGGNRKVEAGFRSAFPEATDIAWAERKSFAIISFIEYGQPVQAYYDYDGNQLAICRNVLLNNMTMPALTSLKQKYSGYRFIGGVEMDHAVDGHSYYVSMQKNNRRVILRVSLDGGLRVFKTMKVTDIHLPAFANAEDMIR